MKGYHAVAHGRVHARTAAVDFGFVEPPRCEACEASGRSLAHRSRRKHDHHLARSASGRLAGRRPPVRRLWRVAATAPAPPQPRPASRRRRGHRRRHRDRRSLRRSAGGSDADFCTSWQHRQEPAGRHGDAIGPAEARRVLRPGRRCAGLGRSAGRDPAELEHAEGLFSTFADAFKNADFTDPQSLVGLQDDLQKFADKQDEIAVGDDGAVAVRRRPLRRRLLASVRSSAGGSPTSSRSRA